MADVTARPELAAGQITATVDQYGREVLVIPDEVALAMEAERRNGWQECRGFAYGNSRPFPAGTWMYRTITTLLAVYVASPFPEQLTGYDRVQAEAARRFATRWSEMRVNVVGASDWNPDTRTWRDFPANAGLHVFGWPHKHYEGDAFVLSG